MVNCPDAFSHACVKVVWAFLGIEFCFPASSWIPSNCGLDPLLLPQACLLDRICIPRSCSGGYLSLIERS